MRSESGARLQPGFGVQIRPAEPRDAEALVELGREVGAEPEGWLITTGGWRTAGEERRYLKAIRRWHHAAVFVAEADVADLGLMVAADRRGRGIGRALLSAAVDWARDAGVTKLELHVFPWNEPAIRLYERFGFEREGVRRGHYLRDGEEVDAILMAYHL
jgi:ribosomal protein S18 acetylase RimI-like enzyme